MTQKHLDRIVVDPNILVGKPTIRGTRISVELVLEALARDFDVLTLMEAYPRLTREDIQACLEYAQVLVEGEGVFWPVDQSTTCLDEVS